MEFEARMRAIAVQRGWISESTPPGTLYAQVGTGQLSPAQLQELLAEALGSGNASSVVACPASWVETPDGDSRDILGRSAETQIPPSLSSRFASPVLLGRGGASDVYGAFDTVLQRPVALKFIRSEGLENRDWSLREARAQAQLDHPNICHVFDVGELDGHPFILMQLVSGTTLHQEHGHLNFRQKLEVVRDIAGGIQTAHRRGLVHLDLKPGNILMESLPGGGYRPLVTDFGLYISEHEGKSERLTLPWFPLGTPPFSSPEQVAKRWDKLGRQSDIYSLGVVLYCLLANASPFAAESLDGLKEAILKHQVIPLRVRVPEVTAELDAIVRRCMAPDPADRYPSALALAEDLQRYLYGEPVQAHGLGWGYRARKWIRRQRALSAAILCAVVGVALWGGAVWRSRRAVAQAQLYAQQFTRDIEEAKQLLRLSHMSPLHDHRPEVRELRRRMAAIQRNRLSFGSAALGPGAFALALAHSDLGELEEAQRWMEEARRIPGLNLESDEAYGDILSRRYLKALVASRDRFNKSESQASLDQIYRVPALSAVSHIPPGRRSSYVKARMALLDGHLEEAEAHLGDVQRQQPWRYEAWVDLAMLLSLRYTPDLVQNKPEEAKAQWERKVQAMRYAVQLAPSDPAVHYLYSQFVGSGRSLPGQQAPPEERKYLKIMQQALDEALVADPDFPSPHQGLCTVLFRLADIDDLTQKERSELIDLSIWHGERSLALDPNNAKTMHALAVTCLHRSGIIHGSGGDPMPDNLRAIDLYEKAAALDPASRFAWHGWIGALLDQVEILLERGKSFQPALGRATQLLDEVQASSPAAYWMILRCRLEAKRAEVAAASGLDPAPFIARAEVELARESAWKWMDLSGGMALKYRGQCRLAMALFEKHRRGKPSAETLALARKALIASLRKAPDNLESKRLLRRSNAL